MGCTRSRRAVELIRLRESLGGGTYGGEPVGERGNAGLPAGVCKVSVATA